jgi:hypothetical protein
MEKDALVWTVVADWRANMSGHHINDVRVAVHYNIQLAGERSSSVTT